MTAAKPMSALRRCMIDDLTLRNLSLATQRSYLHAINKFSRHSGCPPAGLDGKMSARSKSIWHRSLSWPALNQSVCALRFFHGVTLDHAEILERISSARTPRKLRSILGANEVVRFLESRTIAEDKGGADHGIRRGLARPPEAVSL
jgi:integrase/recombinase XerD